MKNNKGFTLVELLAMLVVLGILMAVTVPNITGILNNQKVNGIKQDVVKMVDTAKIKVAKDDSIPKPKNEQVVIFSLNYLDVNDDLVNGPNGGYYHPYESFVAYKRENKQYKYYVRLVEVLSDGKYYGLEYGDFADLEELDIGTIKTLNDIEGKDKDTDKTKIVNFTKGTIIQYYLGNQATFDEIKEAKEKS